MKIEVLRIIEHNSVSQRAIQKKKNKQSRNMLNLYRFASIWDCVISHRCINSLWWKIFTRKINRTHIFLNLYFSLFMMMIKLKDGPVFINILEKIEFYKNFNSLIEVAIIRLHKSTWRIICRGGKSVESSPQVDKRLGPTKANIKKRHGQNWAQIELVRSIANFTYLLEKQKYEMDLEVKCNCMNKIGTICLWVHCID